MEMKALSRRQLLRLAVALPSAGLFGGFRALAASHLSRVKITSIKAMAIKGIAGNCLVRIDTDSGLVGYGEAGVSGPMARSRLAKMTDLLIGKDPLAIEVHFHNMSSLMHPYMAHIPTISGVDIALWDLAGKVLNAPVYTLLGGPFRDSIAMYSHGGVVNALDKGSCRAWAERVSAMQEGFTAFKNDIERVAGIPSGRFTPTLTSEQLRNVAHGFANYREAVGDSIDLGVHCHNEFDTPSAIAVAKAVEPMNPLFLEDALNPSYSEAWIALRRSTRIPLLTGEKLEMVSGFKPFIDNQAVDYIQPDLAFAGGFTGTKKVADYAALCRTPVALHNVGSLVLTYASAHFGASIQNFYRSESQLGERNHYLDKMAASSPPEVRKGFLKVPIGPGLGLEINPDFLKENLEDGETYWT
jgi:L-alanine-DL-glutamate epimerase-like enolase superfamily enzyme